MKIYLEFSWLLWKDGFKRFDLMIDDKDREFIEVNTAQDVFDLLRICDEVAYLEYDNGELWLREFPDPVDSMGEDA
jgi:hypothetical protein